MKAGKYNFQDLFVNRYVEQLIIPEIQRDYVWGQPQVEGLLSSIANDFKHFQHAAIPSLSLGEVDQDLTQLKNDFAEFYRQRNYSSNIGFIYAYSDQQYDGRYFLIDGQQRITTLYLVLLLLAVRTDKEADFEKKYCSNGMPKLDYRVRDSARDFIRQLVSFVLSHPDDDIKEQCWYLNSYENDITVKSIISNRDTINSWLAKNELFESDFYDYLNAHTEFWYFDTNISAQGENLYIYLNARGEQMQENENLKAELLSVLNSYELKNKMGAKWEGWQDFFWRVRDKGVNPARGEQLNADKGFNEFLNCVAGLKIYLESEDNNWVVKDKSLKPSQTMLTQVLSLEAISKYIKALKFIDDEQHTLAKMYCNTEWVNKFLSEFWAILNSNTTAWITDYKNARYSTEHRRMVFVWGVLHWVDSAINAREKLTIHRVFRGIRQFYLRYKNNYRSVIGNNGIKSSVKNLLESGFISTRADDEEYKKERWLVSMNETGNRTDLEAMLWQIEDHPLNIDGSDVGLINSSHLINFNESLTIETLSKIKDTLYDCFSPDKLKVSNKFPAIQSLLLHYGQFWNRKSPYYYENYQFNDWRNIVRSRSQYLTGNEFNDFFNELMGSNLSVEQLLTEKRKRYVESKGETLWSQLLWYNNYLQEDMWAEGAYIALCENYTDNKNDQIFDSSKPFLNTKGDFKGGNPRELYTLLPEEKRSS
ncbi:MAG: hypothetical protein ACJA0H_001548 [Francisellaceae bacterium]|jgi:hypothetical protein